MAETVRGDGAGAAGKFRLGKRPAVFDARTVRFGSYVQPQLPPPPATVDFASRVPTWPMYDNDRYGDCTCAAAGHMIQAWTAAAGAEVAPPDGAVLAFYEHFVGAPPPPDAGCNMLDVLKYWRKTGVGRHRIAAFASLEPGNDVQIRDGIALFGGIYIGLALPDFAVRGNLLTVPWVVPPQGPVGNAAPNDQNGHCVCIVGYDTRSLYAVTWGELKPMSFQFLRAYCDEAYAIVSADFIGPGGRDIDGFDMKTLEADVQELGRLPSAAPVPTV